MGAEATVYPDGGSVSVECAPRVGRTAGAEVQGTAYPLSRVAADLAPLRPSRAGDDWPAEEADVSGPAPRGPVGPQGPPRSFRHRQETPAASWLITHGLGLRIVPTLRLEDSPSEPVFTTVQFVDDDTVIVEWPEPVSGWADF